ncbi:N-acetylmuramic acid 6-phosphate etherase [Nakamurella endophytica]|uniref:N-acetylmuramic acid 6-phosphate etherase n=1 Tax=Nakamurella endophytica TaxID=1748367 RepID=A0A917SLA0_9ACTN|nr:N-acetylmuramic acid 6-phosphate etherase [Nakamurella endophytica]GGL86705.1 N-acetylmuramic acid 6-phosphate etherase [Nakamurella endophytica]
MSAPADRVRVVSTTEDSNPRTSDIDVVDSLTALRMLNAEDARVPGAVAAALPALAGLVDAAVDRVARGGRVHYFGAGTSGRLGVLDAAELLPTFGIQDGVVVAHQAGGARAFVHAVENAEDDLSGDGAVAVTSGDVVVGLAASGRTPYVEAALRAGRAAGAVTALVTANPQAPLLPLADHRIVTDTGPEAIAGSTRLKAGSALKLVLNSFSTVLMVRLGHTYRNLMVDMRPTNAKLRGRSVALLQEATGAAEADCERALDVCGDIKSAVVYLLGAPVDLAGVRAALAAGGGHVRAALAALAAR